MTATIPPAPVRFPTTFKDKFGREWRVRLTAGVLGRLRREAGIDLARLSRSEARLAGRLGQLFRDQDQLGRFLWVLVAEEAEARGVTPEDYVAGFDAATLERCASAVVCALAEFLPRSAIARATVQSLTGRVDVVDGAGGG